jgi:hypothetical protein
MHKDQSYSSQNYRAWSSKTCRHGQIEITGSKPKSPPQEIRINYENLNQPILTIEAKVVDSYRRDSHEL